MLYLLKRRQMSERQLRTSANLTLATAERAFEAVSVEVISGLLNANAPAGSYEWRRSVSWRLGGLGTGQNLKYQIRTQRTFFFFCIFVDNNDFQYWWQPQKSGLHQAIPYITLCPIWLGLVSRCKMCTFNDLTTRWQRRIISNSPKKTTGLYTDSQLIHKLWTVHFLL